MFPVAWSCGFWYLILSGTLSVVLAEGPARAVSISLVSFLAGWSLRPAAAGRVKVVLFGCGSAVCCAGGSTVSGLLLAFPPDLPFLVGPSGGCIGCCVVEFWLRRSWEVDRSLLLCRWSWLAGVMVSLMLSVAIGACGVAAFGSLSRKLYGLCVILCLRSRWFVLRSGKTVLVCLNVRRVGGGDRLLSRCGGA